MALGNMVRERELQQSLELVGYVIGESKPYRAEVVSFRPLKLGEYLYMEYYDYRVVALVSASITGSPVIGGDVLDPRDIERLLKSVRASERLYYYRGTVKILGHIANENKHHARLLIPSVPPPPGTEVFKASKAALSTLFSPNGREYVRVGTLLREPAVEVRVNINKVVSRHLGIIAMTGMGKSNLVALLSRRVSELGGTIVIFDYHGEYTSMRGGRAVVNVVEPRINPRNLSFEELARLLNVPKNAVRQRTVLRDCVERVNHVQSFFDALRKCVQSKTHHYGAPAQKVADTIYVSEALLRRVIDEGADDVLRRLALGAINVVDLSELHVNQADAVVSHWLSRLLTSRKMSVWTAGRAGLPSPLLAVIEEAHAFIPSHEETATKASASIIVREGRKFGLGLVVVSQRPRGLDPTILSQLGNLAIMRIVHPEDQSFVAKYCEPAMQDLIDELPGLNVGEAILLGEWVPAPVVAKIDYVSEKPSGFDIDAVALWAQGAASSSRTGSP